MKAPRFLRVLVAPRATFEEVIDTGKGFGALFGMLAVEFVLVYPFAVATAAMRIPSSPVAGTLNLWSLYVHTALPVAIGVFVGGILLYYVLRWGRRRRQDLWTAASVLTYAWMPHVLMVALGVLVAAAGVMSPILPQYPLAAVGGAPVALLKVVVAFGPSIVWGLIAVRTSWRSQAATPAGNATPNGAAMPESVATSAGATAAGGQAAVGPSSQAAPLPRRRLWAVAVATALIVGSAVAVDGHLIATHWRQVRPVLAGDVLPHFELAGLNGRHIDSTDLRGSVVLMDFWATWCPPCVASQPSLEKMHEDLADQGFRLVSVNTEADAPDTVRAFIKQHHLTFPVYVDNGSLQRRFRVQTFPTAFLIDRRGVVRDVHIGSTSMTSLRHEIETLLKESPPAHASSRVPASLTRAHG